MVIKKIENIDGIHKIKRGVKNASYLAIGHFIAMVINLVGFIFIARILGPNDYGVYTTVVAFVGLFWILTFNGLYKVVLRGASKDFRNLQNLLEKTIGIKFLFTLIAIIVCILTSIFMPYSQREQFYIFFFSFTLLYRSFNGFFGLVFQSIEKMQYNAVIEIFYSILLVPTAILFLYLGYGINALFAISILSQFITLLTSLRLTKKFVRFRLINKIEINKHILKPALIFSIMSFSVILSTKIDIVMISILGTARDVGLYGVAFQIVQGAVGIRTIFATAFFPIFVKTFDKSKIKWKTLLHYSIFLGIGILILAIIGSIYSEVIVVFLFGIEYLESGTILSILILYVAIGFCGIPFTNTLQATNNEFLFLKIGWIAPVLNIGLNYIFFIKIGLIGIAFSTLVVGLINLLIIAFFTRRIVKGRDKKSESFDLLTPK